MIKLYCFGPAWGVDDPSPFCLKVLTFLRLTSLPFVTRTGFRYMRAAPKKKLPYIDDDGTIVPDSVHIIEHLGQRYDACIGAAGTNEERGAIQGLCRMLDEDLYWQIVWFRWADPLNWERFTKPMWFDAMPWPKRAFWSKASHRYVARTLYQQGTGRHSADQVAKFGVANLQAVADYLGDKPYIAGGDPGDVDATIYGFLENVATPPHESPLKDFVLAHDGLVHYLERMRAKLAAAQGAYG